MSGRGLAWTLVLHLMVVVLLVFVLVLYLFVLVLHLFGKRQNETWKKVAVLYLWLQ